MDDLWPHSCSSPYIFVSSLCAAVPRTYGILLEATATLVLHTATMADCSTASLVAYALCMEDVIEEQQLSMDTFWLM